MTKEFKIDKPIDLDVIWGLNPRNPKYCIHTYYRIIPGDGIEFLEWCTQCGKKRDA